MDKCSVSSLSDALDTLGYDNSLWGIDLMTPGLVMEGPAYLIEFEDVSGEEAAPAADYIDDVPAGSVVLINNNGRTDCTVWGDILTHVAKNNGLKGTVINGAFRDMDAIIPMSYPVFAKGTFMRSGKNRVKMVAKDVASIKINDVVINKGDFLVGDSTGVIVIPKEIKDSVYKLGLEIEAMEDNVLRDIGNGIKLSEARLKNNYNKYSFSRN